tara:strand:+ start:46865 stop:48007 length:1143 start_codon:yes stop_codon:yes gene_type:complete
MNIQNKFIGILTFLLSPIISFIFVIANYLRSKTLSNPFFLILTVSIFLSLINSVKVVESDLVLYLRQFELSKELTYLGYIFVNIKDPFFYSFNYIFYNFITTDFQFYIFSLSLLSYCFLLLSIFNFSKWIGLDYRFSLFSLLIAALFPQIFSFSAHLLRQFFAMSVGFYALSIYFLDDKKKIGIILLFISCLIHSSNLLFFSLLFLSFSPKKLFKLSFLITPIIVYLYSIVSIDNPLLGGFVRLKNITSGSAELDSVGTKVVIVCVIIILFNFGINRIIKPTQNKITLDRFFIFFNIVFFFFFVTNNSELSNRLIINIYLFWPLLFSYFLHSLKIKRLLIFPSLMFFSIFFSYNLFYGVWSYEDLEIILFPLKLLISNLS